jgi:hypothetical protein
MIPPLECQSFERPGNMPCKFAYYRSLLRWFIYKIMYDIKTVIASFLRKLQQNFAQSQYFSIHTTKRVVMGFHWISAQLWLAINSHNNTFRGVNRKILQCGQWASYLSFKSSMCYKTCSAGWFWIPMVSKCGDYLMFPNQRNPRIEVSFAEHIQCRYYWNIEVDPWFLFSFSNFLSFFVNFINYAETRKWTKF